MTDPSKSLPVPAARGTTGANLQKEQEVWEGSTLLHGDDIPKELRRQNPPTKDTVPAGTLTVNEKALAIQKMMASNQRLRRDAAIEEAKDPARERVARDFREESERMNSNDGSKS